MVVKKKFSSPSSSEFALQTLTNTIDFLGYSFCRNGCCGVHTFHESEVQFAHNFGYGLIGICLF